MFNGPQYRALVREGPRPLRSAFVVSQRFLSKNPLLCKMAPCAVGFAFGDLLTQLGQQSGSPAKREQPFRWDLTKAAAMAAVGLAVAAPVGLQFLRALDVLIPATGPIAGTVKFVLDQVVGCVIWQVAYCSLSPEYRVGLMAFLESIGARGTEVATSVAQRVRVVETATA